MPMHKPAKRIVLINRDFQIKYAKLAVLVSIVTTCLTLFAIVYPLYIFKVIRVAHFLPTPFFVGIGLAMLVNCLITGFLTIHLTHRAAGPMFAMTRVLREIGDRKFFGLLHVRDGDDFKFVVNHLNDTITNLANLTKEDLMVIEGTINQLEKQENNNSDQNPQDDQSSRESFDSQLGKLKSLRDQMYLRINA